MDVTGDDDARAPQVILGSAVQGRVVVASTGPKTDFAHKSFMAPTTPIGPSPHAASPLDDSRCFGSDDGDTKAKTTQCEGIRIRCSLKRVCEMATDAARKGSGKFGHKFIRDACYVRPLTHVFAQDLRFGSLWILTKR